MKKFPKSLPTFASVLEGPAGGFQGETPPITFTELVDIFGDPATKLNQRSSAGDKRVSTMWLLKFSNGVLASIYDFKATSLYSHELPLPSTFRKMETKWHVGGDFADHKLKKTFSDAHTLVLASIFLVWPKARILKAAREARETWVAPYFLSTAQVIAASRLAGKDYEQEFADLISYKGGYKV